MSARTQGLLLIVSLAACTRQREPQCGGTRDYDDEMCDSQGLADRGGCLPPREGHGQQKIVHQPSIAPDLASSGEPLALAPPLLLERALTLGGAPVEHAFPTEQEVGVAIPFYFEPPQTFVFKNAQLCSKAFGEAKWSCDVMRALGAGLAAVVPCERTMWTGNLRYFVRLRDASGETIESLGSAKEPFVVAVRQTRQGGPPRTPSHAAAGALCVARRSPTLTMRIPSSLSLPLALAGAFALAACSPPMGPERPSDAPSTTGAPADSTPAPEPTEEADSPAVPSPEPTASPTAISADPGPETVPDMTGVPQEPDVISAFGGSPPSACVGGRVNLAGLGACMCQMAFPPVRNPNGSLSVRAGSSCGQPHYHRDLQLSLSGSLTPSKASVRSGEDIQVEATLKNLTSKRLPLVFATEVQDLGPEGLRPRLAVLDAAGKDVGAGGCISGGSASAGHLMVVIDPKGTAYYPIAWKVGALLGAQSGARCLFHTKALPPGKYTLSWRLPIEESQSLPASVVALKGAIEILP